MEEIGTGIVRLEWSGDGKSYTAIVNLEDKYGDIPVPGTIRGRELLSGSDVRIDHTLRISKEPLLISHEIRCYCDRCGYFRINSCGAPCQAGSSYGCHR